MSTTTGKTLNLVKPELTDDHKVTIGTDLPANFQKIDDEVSKHLADGVHQKASITNTDAATSSTNAPLKSAGGLAVAKNIVIGGGVRTGRGTTTSTASGTPVTMFTPSAVGLYVCIAYLENVGAPYHAEAMVLHDGAKASIVQQKDGTHMAITLSGTNVQGTQSSGVAQAIRYIYIRIA